MSASPDVHAPIAIVGLSCRFAGSASTPSKFWDLLKAGRSGFSDSTARYNADAFYHSTGKKDRQNVLPTKGGFFLEQDPYVFDAAFFNITAAEAMALDPKQRMAMEVAYEALENAGIPLQKVSGSQTACFMGSAMSDYRDAVARDFGNYPKYHLLGTSEEMISNRVSHFLNIHGPSATVATACSSSHVATHLACQALRTGEADMALAGGVGLILGPEATMHLNNLSFLSPVGQSKTFDDSAAGYGRGEGCGLLVLKRLDDAIRDGDRIRAVIRASGVNSDGWTQGVTMPSRSAQAALIKSVYESYGLDYGATQYVEAHGTGTKAGDPVETGAIHSTIGSKTTSTRRKLWIGSVKPNIGHLEAAAGVASIIKGVLAIENSLIPPNINFSNLNPDIPLEQWGMAVPTKLTPWPACQVRRMSVSGFGMGGTNAHLVLESPERASLENGGNGLHSASSKSKKRLFAFSSHDQAGFKRLGKSLVEHLDALGSAAARTEYLADFAHTYGTARASLSWKATCFAEDVAELREHLESKLGDNGVREGNTPPRLGFVFTGQGAQWARMGIDMLERPAFNASVARSAELLRQFGADWDPTVELSKADKESRLARPEISQPICSVLQIALVDELRSWGIRPVKVVGHSSGEIAAAYCVGALSHHDAIAAAYFRGQACSKLNNRKGGMMAVGCSSEEASEILKVTKIPQVTVACVNAPKSVTLSGDVAALDFLKTTLDDRGIFARRLKVEVAYHSSHMVSSSADYAASLADMEPQPAESDDSPVLVSSVTGLEADPEDLGPYYWVRNLVSPVLFSDALKELVTPADTQNGQNAVDLLVEVGPHSALGGPIEQILAHNGIKNVTYKSVLTRGQSALDTSMNLAAELLQAGIAVDIAGVNGDANVQLLTSLPPYPWNHSERFRVDSRLSREFYAQEHPKKSILGSQMPKLDENCRVWRNYIRLNEEPWLRDHTVGSTVLFPAAGMISMVIEAAQQLADPGKTPLSYRLRDVSFLVAMALLEDTATEVTVHVRPHLVATSGSTPSSWLEFTVSSCAGHTDQLRNNCRGLLSIQYADQQSQQMKFEEASMKSTQIADYHALLASCPDVCLPSTFYSRMAQSALQYGSTFQGVVECRPGSGKTAFKVKIPEIEETFTKGRLDRPFLISGAALDSMFQGTLGSTGKPEDPTAFGFEKPLLPVFIGELEIAANIPGEAGVVLLGTCRSSRYGFNEISAQITMYDVAVNEVYLSVRDFRMSEVDMDGGDASLQSNDVVDPAAIASKLRWDHAYEFLSTTNLVNEACKHSSPTLLAALQRLAGLEIHQRPAIKLIEVVEKPEMVEQTVASTISRDVIHSAQVRFASLQSASTDSKILDAQDEQNFRGETFELNNENPPAETIKADLFIYIAGESSRSQVLKRLIKLANPDASFLVATKDTKPMSDIDGLRLLTAFPVADYIVHIYKKAEQTDSKDVANTNDDEAREIVVLESKEASAAARKFSGALQTSLRECKYSVTTAMGFDADAVAGKSCISLLELERPMLDNLSGSNFSNLRSLTLNCKRALWITSGDNPSFGMVDGFARVINGELANSKFQVLHLSSSGLQVGPQLAISILEKETDDNEFRESEGLLQVSRLYRDSHQNSQIRNHLSDSTRMLSLPEVDRDAGLKLIIDKPGLLDTLHFVPKQETPLGDYDLEIQVKAVGCNFRDIMASMALVPVRGLGQEASGVVLRCGSKTTQFRPGDRVCTLTLGGTLATRTRCDYRCTVKVPEHMSWEEAASMPVIHTTACYALVRLAKLRRGQSVLIHAAAGGVGQGAVQLALHMGLTVFCTVGTDDKRRLIKEQYAIPDEHIFNSRDTSFAQGIMRATNGRGVDCILNSLSGEQLRVSWGCLATFGTFVEIGLRDITDNMRLDMRPFKKSTTFTFINMQTLLSEDPDTLGGILQESFELLERKVLRSAYPLTVYPISRVEDAFRTMQQGKHRGKMVLSFTDGKVEAPVLCMAQDSLRLDPGATYLFVGGLGGLGRSLALEFAECGARNIAFISRSGDSKIEAKTVVKDIADRGVNVKVYRGDLADEPSFLAAMSQCTSELPPIKGVIQMAMVLRDVVWEKMSFEDWQVPLAPKVAGTWNLHKFFNHQYPLSFMIFCSSTSGTCGNASQAQYAAGNTYQDQLAHYRRSHGLKAVAVNLGIMRDVGVLAETGTHNLKVWEEALGIREPAFRALMKSLVDAQTRDNSGPIVVPVGLGTGDILASHGLNKPAYFRDARFGPLAVTSVVSTNAGGDSAVTSLASKLSEAVNDGDAVTIITDALVRKTAAILRIPASEVDSSKPLYFYGVDSLVALEVRNWITKEMKASIALLEILAAVPMKDFAVKIAQRSSLVNGS